MHVLHIDMNEMQCVVSAAVAQRLRDRGWGPDEAVSGTAEIQALISGAMAPLQQELKRLFNSIAAAAAAESVSCEETVLLAIGRALAAVRGVEIADRVHGKKIAILN